MPDLTQSFLNLADSLVKVSQISPYGISIGKFDWGSNSTVANEGLIKLIAFKHTKNTAFIKSALSDLDYLLGKNATGYCFVTGFGTKKVMHIHHRPSEADGISEPVPGFLSGGPNTVVMTDCPPKIPRSKWPAKSYGSGMQLFHKRSCHKLECTFDIFIGRNSKFLLIGSILAPIIE